VVTGTHTPTRFYCFGSLAAPRLSNSPFPSRTTAATLSGTGGVPPSAPDDHPPPSSHGVARPLIRPSTPFGQTSTHRSRKPAPCPPALPLVVSFSHPSLARPSRRSFAILALVRPPSTRPPATLSPTTLQALARIPRMHQLFLIVCLTRTHATAAVGIRARFTYIYTHVCIGARLRAHLRTSCERTNVAHTGACVLARARARARVRA